MWDHHKFRDFMKHSPNINFSNLDIWAEIRDPIETEASFQFSFAFKFITHTGGADKSSGRATVMVPKQGEWGYISPPDISDFCQF